MRLHALRHLAALGLILGPMAVLLPACEQEADNTAADVVEEQTEATGEAIEEEGEAIQERGEEVQDQADEAGDQAEEQF